MIMVKVRAVISALWKIGGVWVAVVEGIELFGVSLPPVVRLPYLLCLFVFIDAHFWISIWQVIGNFYAKAAHRSNLPSEANYQCKVDYILPFEGKWTVINGGVGKGLSHSWDIVAQRYAYDFIIMDDAGKSFDGDAKKLQSYYCYGKNVLSPADGVVVKVSNKQVDSRVNGEKVYCDGWDIRGNFVVIKHAEKEYSVAAHLIPGSITVRKGDTVQQGQAIAKCGNSGNTSEPHFHFQLQSGQSFFTSAGLPVGFVNIRAAEKTNYGIADPRAAQKETLPAGGGRVYIGRGLEVENGKQL